VKVLELAELAIIEIKKQIETIMNAALKVINLAMAFLTMLQQAFLDILNGLRKVEELEPVISCKAGAYTRPPFGST